MAGRRDSYKSQAQERMVQGQSVYQVYDDLGSPVRTLYRWRQQALDDLPPLDRDYILDELRMMLHRVEDDEARLRILALALRCLPEGS